jgi:hypothetical protein
VLSLLVLYFQLLDGYVCLHHGFELLLILLQRPLFGAQGPLGLIFGIGIFFSIPKSFTSGQKGAGEGTIMAKLSRIDYLGAVTLVHTLSLSRASC